MKKLTILLALAAIVCVLSGCGNLAPVIATATPNTSYRVVTGSGPIIFGLSVTDPDDDPLTYAWAATAGSPSSGSGSSFVWTPPAAVGNYAVQVSISDGEASASYKWNVEVVNGPTYTVTGQIKSALTSVLITEAVDLYIDGVARTITGGMFTVENLTSGSHTFRVDHAGFLEYQSTLNVTTDRHLVIPLISASDPILDASWANKYEGSNEEAFGVVNRGSFVYVSTPDKILKYTLSGTLAGTFAAGLTNEINHMTFDPSGNMWGIDSSGDVHKFNSSGTISRTYDHMAVPSSTIWGLAVDSTYIYVSDPGSQKVKKHRQSDGAFVAEVASADSIAFNGLCQLAFGPDGYLYTSDFYNGRIVVLSTGMSVIRTINIQVDGEPYDPRPMALTFGPDGCLYAHDRGNYCIKKISPLDEVILEIATLPMWVNSMSLDVFGNLYVTDNSSEDAKVHKYHWDRSARK